MLRNINIVFLICLLIGASVAWATFPDIGSIESVPFVCVDTFGAIAGDGLSDSAAFAKARDHLTVGSYYGSGGKILLGSGAYDLTVPLVLPTGITIEGVGNWSSLILTSVVGTYAIQVYNTVGDAGQAGRFSMKNIYFGGRDTGQATQTGGLFIRDVCNSHILDTCFVYNLATGVCLASAAYYNTFSNTVFTQNATGAYAVTSPAIDGHSKSGNRFENCWFHSSAVDFRCLVNTTVENCGFDPCTALNYCGQWNVFENNHMELWQFTYRGFGCFEIGSYTRFTDNICATDYQVYYHTNWSTPMFTVVGEKAYLEIPPYLFDDNYICLIATYAKDNNIIIRAPMSDYKKDLAPDMASRGQGNMILDESLFRNNVTYEFGTKKTAFIGDYCESKGMFIELGTVNDQVGNATATLNSTATWRINIGVTTATLDIPYPYGRSAASDAAYFTKITTPSTATQTTLFYGPLLTLPGSAASPLTISALVYVPSTNAAGEDLYMGISSGFYAKSYVRDRWDRLVFRRYFTPPPPATASEQLFPSFTGGNATGSQVFYIGEVSVVQGDCPGFFPNPTNAAATFSHFEK
jgi:hypothetical protein